MNKNNESRCKFCGQPLTKDDKEQKKEFCSRDCFLIYMEETKNTIIYNALFPKWKSK